MNDRPDPTTVTDPTARMILEADLACQAEEDAKLWDVADSLLATDPELYALVETMGDECEIRRETPLVFVYQLMDGRVITVCPDSNTVKLWEKDELTPENGLAWDWAWEIVKGSDWWDLLESEIEQDRFVPGYGYVFGYRGASISVTLAADCLLGGPTDLTGSTD